jgi:hypothetical protein
MKAILTLKYTNGNTHEKVKVFNDEKHMDNYIMMLFRKGIKVINEVIVDNKILINEDGTNIPKELFNVMCECDEDNDPYREMERLRMKANLIGYDFDYDLSGTPTEFWKI